MYCIGEIISASYRLYLILIVTSLSYADLRHPENGQDLTYVHVWFEWDQEPNSIAYNLQVSNQSSFTSTILNIEEMTTVYVDTENIDWDDTYYWRIRPVYINGDFGEWSEIYNFITGEKIFPVIAADIYNDTLVQDGLIAFGGFAPDFSSAVIDKYGNEVWNTGEEGSIDFMVNHINAFGTIYGMSLYDYPGNTGT